MHFGNACYIYFNDVINTSDISEINILCSRNKDWYADAFSSTDFLAMIYCKSI